MNNRDVPAFTPPYSHPANIITRYLESLMHLTYENPVLITNMIKITGVSSLALMAAPFVSSALGYEVPAIATLAAVAAGAAGIAGSRFSWFMQNKFYGLPLEKDALSFLPDTYSYFSARGEMILDDNHLQRLKINSDNHYDSGYVEGYMLGAGMRENLTSTNFLYKSMWLLGAPWMKANVASYLNRILETIPEIYRREMRGKVDGYNQWLHDHNIQNEDLELHYYLLLQLLPDIRNYNPFSAAANVASAMPDISPACTTIALRIGDYTFFTRVLDWPAYNIAGKSFMQIERNITGTKRTIDVGFPLLSGALTVLNDEGMLIEMNVAHGRKVVKPEGMPAVFFNRYCAENAGSVKELAELIANNKPLGAYHLTATDGIETRSFHFYQNEINPETHVIEELNQDKSSPQLLVVANHGLEFHGSGSSIDNHRDSDQRKQNIYQLFSEKNVQDKFAGYISKQSDQRPLPPEDILELKEFCLQVARLPLICNCSSVLCALYVYHHDKLIDTNIATDNLYAQRTELEDFKRLAHG